MGKYFELLDSKYPLDGIDSNEMFHIDLHLTTLCYANYVGTYKIKVEESVLSNLLDFNSDFTCDGEVLKALATAKFTDEFLANITDTIKKFNEQYGQLQDLINLIREVYKHYDVTALNYNDSTLQDVMLNWINKSQHRLSSFLITGTNPIYDLQLRIAKDNGTVVSYIPANLLGSDKLSAFTKSMDKATDYELSLSQKLILISSELNFNDDLLNRHNLLGLIECKRSDGSARYQRLTNIIKKLEGPAAFLTFKSDVKQLFNRCDEVSEIVNLKRIYAVVELPQNTLAMTSLPTCLVLLGAKGETFDSIKMMILKDDQTRSRGGPVALSDDNMVKLNALINHEQLDDVVEVALEKIILEPKLGIAPESYVFSQEQQLADKLISKMPRKLKDIASILRPVLIKAAKDQESADGCTEYSEISTTSINDIGCISSGQRNIKVLDEHVTKGFKNMVLRDNDLVFFIKGVVGKCGLVVKPQDNVLCSQSALIIRLNDDVQGISPVALQRYLSSDEFNTYLQKFVTKSALMYIAASEVQNFPVPNLTEEQLAAEQEAFNKQQEILAKIVKLQEELEGLKLNTLPESWTNN